jgi:hypothetical protein
VHAYDHHLRAVTEFAQHFGKAPDKLGLKELRSYQAYLLKERKPAAHRAQELVVVRTYRERYGSDGAAKIETGRGEGRKIRRIAKSCGTGSRRQTQQYV